ncbi:MAG: CRISPR-associated endonuclease Cas2 [Sulfobacillus sp.]
MIFGGLRTVWILTLFDLPTESKEDKRAYRDFRTGLLNDGFVMLQFSVYGRHCGSSENQKVHETRVRRSLPAGGEVRLLTITDQQFSRMKVFRGRVRQATERAPEQITLF